MRIMIMLVKTVMMMTMMRVNMMKNRNVPKDNKKNRKQKVLKICSLWIDPILYLRELMQVEDEGDDH